MSHYTHWNYRVIKRYYPVSEDYTYNVHEVYYTDGDVPVSYSSLPVKPQGSTLEELKADLERFQAALSKPVLTEEDFVK